MARARRHPIRAREEQADKFFKEIIEIAGAQPSDQPSSTRVRPLWGLTFRTEYLRTYTEFVSMTTIVRCPRTGRACSEGACRERHWCRQLFERGLSHRGLPLKRKFRPRCCAKTRAGAPCIMRFAGKVARPVARRNVHRAQTRRLATTRCRVAPSRH